MNVEYMNQISWYSFGFAITGFTFGRLGVPIFLFLTGYLLLDRFFEQEDCYKFWRKNWKGLLITTEIWIIIYDVFLRLFHFQHWNNMKLIKDMLFMTQVNMGHMWYMPMIIGVYIFIPFVARAVNKLNIRTLFFPLLFLSFYAFAIPILQVLNKVFSYGNATSVLNLGFSGGVYGIYIILGFCIKRGILNKFSTKRIAITTIIFFVMTVFLQLIAYKKGITYNVWYNCGLLMICSLFLFEFISRVSIFEQNKYVNWISRNSFGIYLVHFPFIILLRNVLKDFAIMLPFKVVILWALALIISSVICVFINKNAKMSRYLLYNR